MSKSQLHVYARLPRAGIGNKLFIWARAVVFSKINGAHYTCFGWSHFSIGLYLRGEHLKRNYRNIISAKHTGITDRIGLWFYKIVKPEIILIDPPVAKADVKQDSKVIFSAVPHWADYFMYLKEYRTQLYCELFEIAAPAIKNIVNSTEAPFFSVHIRLGDFKKLSEGIDFKRVGNTRTPIEYFVNGITNVRKVIGSNVPISIFTNGKEEELGAILQLENCRIISGNPDLADLLLMSKSKIIMTSAGSTFGYWAAFFSDAIILMHPDHIHQPLRDDKTNAEFYEGALLDQVKDWSPLLITNLRSMLNKVL